MTIRPSDSLIQSPKSEAEDPELFYQKIQAFFNQAVMEGKKVTDRFLALGGFTVRLCFAESRLIPYIIPALAHLSTDKTDTPALTVYVADGSALHFTPPVPHRPTKNSVYPGIIWGHSNQRRYTAYNFDSGTYSMLDIQNNKAACWISDIDRIPQYERGAPLRPILHWWLRKQGLQLVHGAAVGYPDGGILLTGRGGSGKSTAALACLSSSLLYAGDDYTLLRRKPEPYIDCLYSSAKLKTGQITKFPLLNELDNRIQSREEDKILVFLYPDFSEKITSGFPLRAILIPRITGGGNTKIRKGNPAAGLKALAPSTIFQLPGGGQKDFLNISRLLKQVPCFFLDLGADLAQIPDVISDFLIEKRYGI